MNVSVKDRMEKLIQKYNVHGLYCYAYYNGTEWIDFDDIRENNVWHELEFLYKRLKAKYIKEIIVELEKNDRNFDMFEWNYDSENGYVLMGSFAVVTGKNNGEYETIVLASGTL